MGWFSKQIGSFRWFTALVYPVPLIFFSLCLPARSCAPADASHGKAAKFVLIKLSITWIIVLNAVGWLSIQTGLAWGFTKMPVDWFNPGRTVLWKRSGPFNEVVFRIKDWKVWFGGGFAKRALAGKNRHYLQRFICETWRGELCPRTAMLCAPVFFLWNPRWSDLNILAYTLAANLPCILVHRYNRARFQRLLLRGSRRGLH